MDKELYETAKESYELSKYKHFKLPYELECKLFAGLFEISVDRFKFMLSWRANILSRLPEEILSTVEDMRALAWGNMSKETQKLLKKYLDSIEEQ